jgi:translation elongation factor EF-Ts
MIDRLRSLTGRSLSVCARGLRVAAGVAELAARELRRGLEAPGTTASQTSGAAARDGAGERRLPPG